jgi:hypothetical protein
MEFNLTAEQKIQSLQNAETAMSHEIYNTLLRLGVDPETFEESDIEQITATGLEGETIRLRRLILSLNVIKQKLQNI